ncbi:LAG1 longevity assurance [Salix suchowensis]|nr:LAG1 longevity assurance [Salix suchowensis]
MLIFYFPYNLGYPCAQHDRYIIRLAIWLLHRKVKAIPSRIDEATIRKCSESMWEVYILCYLMLFYMCQCGFYIYSIAALLMWETRRKDLLTIILALHDASDVFLEAAKVFKYSGKNLKQVFLWTVCHLMARTTSNILSLWLSKRQGSLCETLPRASTHVSHGLKMAMDR